MSIPGRREARFPEQIDEPLSKHVYAKRSTVIPQDFPFVIRPNLAHQRKIPGIARPFN